MDRDSLQLLLAQGCSLAEIGRRFRRHESTIAYWVHKHGLLAANHDAHVAKGGLERDQLERMVGEGMSIAQIAHAVGRSKPTVRHWLTRYALKTGGAARRRRGPAAAMATKEGAESTVMLCRRHGKTAFVRDKRGHFRCKRCRSESVARRRRRMKQILVREAGGACRACGYDRNVRGLHFHHLDPSLKRHEVNARGAAMALELLRTEVRKCVLLCANCHAEVEAGLISLPKADGPPYNGA